MISEKDGMVLLYVPAGEFWMGSTDAEVDAAFENCTKDQDGYTCERTWFEAEQPQHKVYLDAYWIDQTEVTNGMYEKCVIDGACSASSSSSSFTRSLYYGNLTYVDYPVIHVDWNNAKAYCEWAGRSCRVRHSGRRQRVERMGECIRGGT